MCFSAGASFTASAIIGVIGVVATAKAKTDGQRVFATIPLIFSFQQAIEGMLWLSVKLPDLYSLRNAFTYAYLFFAMAVWPLWIPLAIYSIEKVKAAKRVLFILMVIGAVITALVIIIFILFPVNVVPTHHHLHYRFHFPEFTKSIAWIFTVLYIIATIIPPFVSRFKRMKWLGIAFLASYIFAIIFYGGFVVSVWCYFAAALSVIVVWILAETRSEIIVEKEKEKDKD
jgi:hypothetical protein